MKPAMSLEEEKRRLLEQLESSRAVYRRMLMNQEEEPVYEEPGPTPLPYAAPVQSGKFPQSQTMRWIMAHPYLLTAGTVAVLVASKKGYARRRSQPKAKGERKTDSDVKKSIAATTFGTTLATSIAMMLRNPAQMQAAMRAFTLAMNYYKSRRGNPRQRFE